MCGRQDHYKKSWPEIECHKCYKKGHISRECQLRESGYSSVHSNDRMRRHEQRTEDRDRSPLYSNICSYVNKCSASVGMVEFACRDHITDGHYDSLLANRPRNIEVTRYVTVVKPVHRDGTIYY